jgi:hypothetical protein
LLKPSLPIRILVVAVPLVCGVAYTFRLLGDFVRCSATIRIPC